MKGNGLFAKEPSKNIRRYRWYFILTGLTFNLPIWVAFYLRIITLEQTAFINAVANLIAVSLEIPTGAIADLIGRKSIVTLGQVLRALTFLAMPFAPNFIWLFILNSLMAVGEAMSSGADSALLYDTLKEEGREKEFSLIYTKFLTYYRICIISASLIGGLLYSLNYSIPYLLRGLAFIASAYFMSQIVEKGRIKSAVNLGSYYRKTIDGLHEITKSIFVKKLSLYYIIVGGITWACLTYFNQPFAYDFGWTTTQMSYITAGAYLVSSLVVYFLTSHKNLLNRERIYLGFPILMVIAFVPGLFVGKWVGLALMTLVQIAGSARFSLLDNYINMEFDSRHRATALSTLNMLVSLGMALLLFVGGKVQGFADTRMVYTLLGILSAVVVLPLAVSLVIDHRVHVSNKIKLNLGDAK